MPPSTNTANPGIQCSPATLLTLPPELHLLITPHLPYPDLLALKHTHPVFYRHQAIHPTVYDRIDWLLDRPRLGLPIPRETKCVMRSDEQFCANAEVRSIMSLRRRHVECQRYGPGAGMCLVVEGKLCWKAEENGSWVIAADGRRWQYRWQWRRPTELSWNSDLFLRVVFLACQVLLGLALAAVLGLIWSDGIWTLFRVMGLSFSSSISGLRS